MMAQNSLPQGLLEPDTFSDPWGCVAVTAGITLPMLHAAYAHGVFPWTDNPVGWFCPRERAILAPRMAHFPRNLPRLMRRAGFRFAADTNFDGVIDGCARAHAHRGVWLTPRFIAAYKALYRQGVAHSVEVFDGQRLVGGLYGVQVGRVFCAESMFAAVSHASKAAVYALVHARAALGVEVIDVQVLSETSEALGAMAIPRPLDLDLLENMAPERRLNPTTWPTRLSLDV